MDTKYEEHSEVTRSFAQTNSIKICTMCKVDPNIEIWPFPLLKPEQIKLNGQLQMQKFVSYFFVILEMFEHLKK